MKYHSDKTIIVRKEYGNGNVKYDVRQGTVFNRTSELWELFMTMATCETIEEAREYRERLNGMELIKEEVVN